MNTFSLTALGLSAALSLSAFGCARPEHPQVAHTNPNVETTSAATAGWEKLGERTVNGTNDHDSILVGKREGRVSKLLIKVDRNDLEMFEMLIQFEDDTVYQPNTRLIFHKGDLSHEIALPGGHRFIKKVDFRYANVNAGPNAKVEVWAR